jgi:Domain of unknown function (DUF3597)
MVWRRPPGPAPAARFNKEYVMGLFTSILEKLGMSEAAAAPVLPSAPAEPAAASTPSPLPPAEVVNPIAMVDVVVLMEERARANPQKLNWRTSIVDLLKLLDIDSSLAARKALAEELYCPSELMGDSAKMNMWLHRNVLAHIAANGGNIPRELLD